MMYRFVRISRPDKLLAMLPRDRRRLQPNADGAALVR